MVRLIVVDAHPSSRERIAAAFADSSEFKIVAFCPDAAAAFLMADLLEPDLFLVDPVLLDSDGYAPSDTRYRRRATRAAGLAQGMHDTSPWAFPRDDRMAPPGTPGVQATAPPCRFAYPAGWWEAG